MSTVAMPNSASGCSAGSPPSLSLEEQSLARAFASFTEAASSLERSYTQLQQEVARLRQELEQTNQDLARSLDENHRMREHLNRIVEGLPCGVVVVEADGRCSTANPEAQRLWGAVYGAPLLPAVRELLDRIEALGGELEYCSAEENAEWITVRRARMGQEDGGSLIFILQNVTGLKRLQQAHELLRRQALAEMSALLAHEIRNPLGSLELFAGLLAASPVTSEQREWVEHLQAGLRTLGATVNNVLHFHSEPLPQLAPTDVGRLLQWLSEFLRPLAERTRVHIVLHHDCDGVVVAADRHRLEQVLLNLGLNALRFMPEGGVLTIAGHHHPQAVCLEVSDTGPGIAAADLEHIFEPGFTTRSGSPGLGLAVCRKIMEQHGAVIRVAASSEHGTTFALELGRACQ